MRKAHDPFTAPRRRSHRKRIMNESHQTHLAAALLRAGLGVMFVAHALLKVFVFTVPGTVQFFQSVGLPGAFAYATIAAELVGGVMLILGVYTRVVALALLPVLLGALWVHSGNGWLFTSANGGWEYPAFLVLAAVVVAVLGGGRYALRSEARAFASRRGLQGA
jgi:putative oxidoreductase